MKRYHYHLNRIRKVGAASALALIALQAASVPAAAADAGTACPKIPASFAHGRLELTAPGIQKSADWGVRQGLRFAEASLPKQSFDDMEFGPQPGKCTPAQLEKMEIKQAWTECYGIPKILKESTGPWRDAAMPEPSRFKLSGLHVDSVKFGKPKVSCSSFECDIEVTVPELSVAGDFMVSDLNGGKERLKVKGVQASLSGNSKGQAITLKLKGKLDANGQLQDLIQVKNESISVQAFPGNIAMGLKMSDQERQATNAIMRVSLYDGLRAKYKLPAVKSDIEKLGAVDALLKKQPDLLSHDPVARDALLKGMHEALGPHFDSDQTADLFVIANWFMNDLSNSPEFVSQFNDMIVKKYVVPMVGDQVRTQLKTLPVVSDDLVQSMRLIPMQDRLDLGNLRTAIARQTMAARKIQLKLMNAETPEEVREAKKDYEAAMADMDDLMKMLNAVQARDKSSVLAQRLVKNWAGVQKLLREKGGIEGMLPANDALSKLTASFADVIGADGTVSSSYADALSEDIAVRLVAAQADQVNQTVQFGVSMCILCARDQAKPNAISDSPAFKAKKDYDAGIQVNLDTINYFFKALYDSGRLNFCITDSKAETCSTDHYVAKSRFTFSHGAPYVYYDAESKNLVLKVPQINQGSGIFGHATALDIELQTGISKDGKRLVFTPKDLDASYRINDSGIFSVVGGVLKALSGIYVVLQDELIEDYGPELMKGQSAEMPIMDGLKLTEVQVSPTALTVYGNMDLPDIKIEELKPAVRAH